MTAAVADTNVLASGFVRRHPNAAPVQVLDGWRAGAFTLVVSDHLLLELERTLSRPYFAARLNREQVAHDLGLLRAEARIVPVTISVRGVATHPEDDLILATAISGAADYLITGDIQLQQLQSFRGVRIVGPRAFVDLLQLG